MSCNKICVTDLKVDVIDAANLIEAAFIYANAKIIYCLNGYPACLDSMYFIEVDSLFAGLMIKKYLLRRAIVRTFKYKSSPSPKF